MRVVAVSPHLDDAAFSIGGTLAALADAGHQVSVLTCFTAGLPAPSGFALACQRDKGLADDADYMELRRAEDDAAMAVLGVAAHHLGLLEAPHRGYLSAPDLFAGMHDGDEAWAAVQLALVDVEADVWLAPQALGDHVDHRHVLRAVAALGRPTAWWRDSPYVLRQPDAHPGPELPGGLTEVRPTALPGRRADACACYTSQLGFQFGGEAGMRAALADFPEVLLADPVARSLLSAARVGAGRQSPLTKSHASRNRSV